MVLTPTLIPEIPLRDVIMAKLPHRCRGVDCKGRRCAKKIANKKATPAGGFLFDPQLMPSRQWRCRSLGWS